MKLSDFKKTLSKEGEKWIQEGIIDKKQYEKINKIYAKQKEEKNLTFIKISSIISVLLIVFGTIMFFSGSWDNMNAFSKVFVIFLGIGIFGSVAYLFIKRKDLHGGFIALLLTSVVFGIGLLVLNKMLNIYMPYYAIFFFRFLCIMPFVLIFRFKYFLIFAVILLHISTFLFVYYYYPDYSILLTFLGIIISSMTMLNIKRIYRVFQTPLQYQDSKPYYHMIYFIGILGILISYIFFSQSFVLSKVFYEIQTLYYNGNSYLIFFVLAFLPLVSFLFVVIAYYFRKKYKFEHGELKNIKATTKRNFQEQIIDYIKGDKGMFTFQLSIILLVFLLLSPINNILNLNNFSFLINVLFIIVNGYFFYEGIYMKMPHITNLSIFGFFAYFILKYFVFFNYKVSLPLLIIGGGLIFMVIGFLIEKNKQIIIKSVSKNIKDGSELYLK